jgi:hypothetical protein
MALDRDQVAPQRAGVRSGDSQPNGLDEGGDDERRLGGPPAVDGGPGYASAGGDPLDGEGPVSLVSEDFQGRLEDGLIMAGVPGSARAPRPTLGLGCGRVFGFQWSLLGWVSVNKLQTLA